jgi:rubredoxin
MSEPTRECPLCGETMRRVERTVTDRVPGSTQPRTSKYFEWVCPECDYFEEIDGDNAGG